MEPILAALFSPPRPQSPTADASAGDVEAAGSELSNATKTSAGETDAKEELNYGYGLLNIILKEYAANAALASAPATRDRCKKGNYGFLHKLTNMIVEADRLTIRGAAGAEFVASPLTAAVAACEEWRAFTSYELLRINEVCGGQQQSQSGPDVSLDDPHMHSCQDPMDGDSTMGGVDAIMSSKDADSQELDDLQSTDWYQDATMEPKDDETDDAVKLALQQMSMAGGDIEDDDDAEDTAWADFGGTTSASAAASDTVTYDDAADFNTTDAMGAEFTPDWDDAKPASDVVTMSLSLPGLVVGDAVSGDDSGIAMGDGDDDAEFTPVWDDEKPEEAGVSTTGEGGDTDTAGADDSSWSQVADVADVAAQAVEDSTSSS